MTGSVTLLSSGTIIHAQGDALISKYLVSVYKVIFSVCLMDIRWLKNLVSCYTMLAHHTKKKPAKQSLCQSLGAVLHLLVFLFGIL